SRLLANGMSGQMPVAVIEQGTTHQQFVIEGTLEDILEKTKEIHPPATIIIGEVVRMRSQIDWFQTTKELTGLRAPLLQESAF
ncbi:MAG TPA: hypothetical protein DCG54_06365, partial [Anaerolineae bacterium]|nr:hypothetical protein [Anaerolineae bacterium]